MADEKWQMTNAGWQMTNAGWQMTNAGWQMTNAAMSVRSLREALADLVDQHRDTRRRVEESGKNGPLNE